MELDWKQYAKLPPKIHQNISKCFDSKLLRPIFQDRNGSVLISLDQQIVMIRNLRLEELLFGNAFDNQRKHNAAGACCEGIVVLRKKESKM